MAWTRKTCDAGLLIASFAILGACTRDEVTGPPPPAVGPLTVSLTVNPPSIVPGQSSLVTTTATVPANQTLTRFDLALSGLGVDTVLELPVSGAGAHGFYIQIHVPHGPIAGELRFKARARMGVLSDSAERTLTVADDGAPRLALSAPTVLEPPDSLTVTFSAEDAAGIVELAIRLEGAVERDTTIHTDHEPLVAWTFAALVPSDAQLGDSVLIQATARDGFGNLTTSRRTVRYADTTPPALQVRVDSIFHAGVDHEFFPLIFFPGDTARVHLLATDQQGVPRMGFRMLQGGDSLTTSGPSDSAVFEYVVPEGTNQPDALIDVFAADSSGNRTQQRVWAHVMNGTFRAIDALNPYVEPLIEYDQQGGYVLDVERDVLYFANFSEEIEVVGLSPLRELPQIELGRSVRSVDLTPGGDTLVAVVVGRPNQLLRWDLAAGVPLAPLAVTMLGDCDAWDMQVTALGRAIVTGWSATTCPTVEVDLRTGAERLRPIPFAVRNLARSGNQRFIVAWNQSEALVYDAVADTMTPLRSLYPAPSTIELAHAGPAIDDAGAVILIRNRVYNSDLTASRWIQPDPGYAPPAPALAANGGVAFLGSWPGYVRVEVATATVLEQIILPRLPWRMLAHPDGERLIVFGWRWIGVVDLR